MAVNAIDNSGLINACYTGCDVAGFTPSVSYTYNAGTGDVVVTNASTLPEEDELSVIHLRLLDHFGGEVKGAIRAGGSGYTSAPTVTFSGGGGSGAAGTAVVENGRVVDVTITNAGTGYTTTPTVAFSGGGGTGAQGTVVRDGTTVGSVTLTPATSVTLSASTLNASKGLKLMATVLTENHIAADGGNYYLQSAGAVANWDIQQNA